MDNNENHWAELTKLNEKLRVTIEHYEEAVRNNSQAEIDAALIELPALQKQLLSIIANQVRDDHTPGKKWQVFVDDNFHYMDESERYKAGEFDTEAEAVSKAKKIVDDFLTQGKEPPTNAEALFNSYRTFGDDPFIPGSKFNAWEYARERCEILCSPKSDKSEQP